MHRALRAPLLCVLILAPKSPSNIPKPYTSRKMSIYNLYWISYDETNGRNFVKFRQAVLNLANKARYLQLLWQWLMRMMVSMVGLFTQKNVDVYLSTDCDWHVIWGRIPWVLVFGGLTSALFYRLRLKNECGLRVHQGADGMLQKCPEWLWYYNLKKSLGSWKN